MNKLNRISVLLLLLFVYSYLVGCAAENAFPKLARAGDTITLAVGSPDGMTHANTTIEYVPDSTGIPITLHDASQSITNNLRSIFKLYPDKTSPAWRGDIDVLGLSLQAHHSPWITIIALDLPLGLPAGTGVIQITSGAIYNSAGFSPHINDNPIGLEIVPGTGSPDLFNYVYNPGGNFSSIPEVRYGDLSELESYPVIIVGPPLSVVSTYGMAAAEITLDVPYFQTWDSFFIDHLSISLEEWPGRNGMTNTQLFSSINGSELKVNIIRPGGLRYDGMRFTIDGYELTQEVVDGVPGVSGPATVTSVKFFDKDGYPITLGLGIDDPTNWTVQRHSVGG